MRLAFVCSSVLTLLLGACGGGGGTGSPPSPPSGTPTPTQTNSSFDGALVSEAFRTAGSASTAAHSSGSTNTVSVAAAGSSVAIGYDASRNTYTVTSGAQSQGFGASDRTQTGPDVVVYEKVQGVSRDTLTLLSARSPADSATRYVRLGYWEHRSAGADGLDTLFSAFTYGFPTAGTSLPERGVASFDTNVRGRASTVGQEPGNFSGAGQFDIDFAAGVFRTQMNVVETGLGGGGGIGGGGIEVLATGKLGSGDGSFTGTVIYGGRFARLAGPFSGRFYGPGAAELGAAFTLADGSGTAVTGAFTGYRDPTNTPVNLTLLNMTQTQRFFVNGVAVWIFDDPAPGGFNPSTSILDGTIDDRTSGNGAYGPGSSLFPAVEFTNTAIVAGDPKFVRYEKTVNEVPVRLELYRRGADNPELALTYSSLGRYRVHTNSSSSDNLLYFVYGLETPAGQLTARTGTARYEGVVYGAGGSRATKTRYELSGSSAYDIDFGAQSYSGRLSLRGTDMDRGGDFDFGGYDFGGKLGATPRDHRADLKKDGATAGELTTYFYGPDGDEIAGRFRLVVPAGAAAAGSELAGVTVAKRR